MNKSYLKSRTIWVNTLALVALVLQAQFGFVLTSEAQGAVLILLNIILRFDTDTAIR